MYTGLLRLGRNMLEILNLIERFNNTGIKPIFTNQPELSKNLFFDSFYITFYKRANTSMAISVVSTVSS